MKTIVLYTSISGFTKKYAEWISQELKAECVELSKAGKLDLAVYDLIVYGGSLHAKGINGFKKFLKISGGIPGGKIIVFAVGASPKKDGIEDEIRKGNFSGGEDDAIKLFYLRGGYDYSKLDAGNKFLMTLLELKIRMKKNKTNDEIGMHEAYKKPLDATRKENIAELIAYARGSGPARS